MVSMVGLHKVLGWMLAMLEKVLLESYAVIRELGLREGHVISIQLSTSEEGKRDED